MNPDMFLETLKSLDLEYSIQSGGRHLSILDQSQVKACGPYEYRAYLQEGDRVRFISPKQFLKTVRQAEEKLEITLFR